MVAHKKKKYRKIDPRIWNDEKFYTAGLGCQHLFLFILTHPQMTPVGAMRTTPDSLKAELDWESKGFPQAFPEAFQQGLARGFWNYGERAKFLAVPKFMKYNPPESPNVVRSWIGCWDDLPECSLKVEVFQTLKDLAKGLGKGFLKAFTEGFPEGLPKDYRESGAGAGVSSVSKDTAADAADPVKQIFDLGIKVLTESGTPKDQARALIGKLRKERDDGEALEVLKEARDKSDPRSFIAACITPKLRVPTDPDKIEAWARENNQPPPRPGETVWTYRERLSA